MNSTNYDRALRAEPKLRHIETLVDILCGLAPTERSGQPMCHGCVWDWVIKPLTTPWVGHGRGYHPDQASDPTPGGPRFTAVLLSEVEIPPRVPSTTETEEWLRTSEAWDAVTDAWLDRLEQVDPGNGHGLPIQKEKSA